MTYVKSFNLWLNETEQITISENKYADWINLRRLGLVDANSLISRRGLGGIQPDEKDHRRAHDLIMSQNPVSRARSMAKLITDPQKMIRRTKAVIRVALDYKPDLLADVVEPFAEELREWYSEEDVLSMLGRYI